MDEDGINPATFALALLAGLWMWTVAFWLAGQVM